MSRKSTLSDGLSERAEDRVTLSAIEGIQVVVIVDTNGPKVVLETRPSANLLLVGSPDHCSACG